MNKKVVVITGAAGGIGSATAKRFSDAEARVVLSDIDTGRLEAIAAKLSPEPGSSVYSATKFGVRGFSLALAMEVRKYGIHVSIICPDSVDTPMLEKVGTLAR